jgi:hypothetical protein
VGPKLLHRNRRFDTFRMGEHVDLALAQRIEQVGERERVLFRPGIGTGTVGLTAPGQIGRIDRTIGAQGPRSA